MSSDKPVRDLMAELRASFDRIGLCPECACEKSRHGTFGWSGCDRRFPHHIATPPTPSVAEVPPS